MFSIPTTDPKQACLEFFSSLWMLTDTAREFLEQRLLVHEFNRDAILLSADQVVNALYYIHSGLLRNYHFDEKGQEITAWFAAENELLYFPSSYRNQIPLRGTVQLLEKSVLVSLTYDQLNELYELDPRANALGRLISENQMPYLLKRERLFHSFNSEERYLTFLELFPNLYGRTQNQHVASYLKLSPGTVSRILSGTINQKNTPSPRKQEFAKKTKRK